MRIRSVPGSSTDCIISPSARRPARARTKWVLDDCVASAAAGAPRGCLTSCPAPTTAPAWRPSRCLVLPGRIRAPVNQYQRESDRDRISAGRMLDGAVNQTGPSTGEPREFVRKAFGWRLDRGVEYALPRTLASYERNCALRQIVRNVAHTDKPRGGRSGQDIWGGNWDRKEMASPAGFEPALSP